MNLLEDLNNSLWKSKNVIYCYTNKINGKKYIGQTIQTLKNRHLIHINETFKKERRNYNTPFHNAIRKYGLENFSLNILHFGESLDELNYFEDFYIKYHDTLSKNNNGYNIRSGGNNKNPFEGWNEDRLKEFKEKCKIKMTGKNNPNYGGLTEEHKDKIRNYQKNRYDEHKKHLSESLKGRTAHNKGVPMSEEQKEKIKNNWANISDKDKKSRCRKMSKNRKNRRKVIGISLKENKVIILESSSSAENFGFHQASVHRCCKGKQKTSQGYKFYFLDEYKKQLK